MVIAATGGMLLYVLGIPLALSAILGREVVRSMHSTDISLLLLPLLLRLILLVLVLLLLVLLLVLLVVVLLLLLLLHRLYQPALCCS
jgi:hypothetical protein